MQPFERFKKANTEDNLWIYILTLGRNVEIPNENIRRLIFEGFEFLPGKILTPRVLYRLEREGYIRRERFQCKRAYKTTEKGIAELDKMKLFCKELLEKI